MYIPQGYLKPPLCGVADTAYMVHGAANMTDVVANMAHCAADMVQGVADADMAHGAAILTAFTSFLAIKRFQLFFEGFPKQ